MKTNLEIAEENESKIIDLTVKFREAKELIESQAEEIKQIKLDRANMFNYLSDINAIMFESFMIKGRDFGRTEGLEIMKVLEKWATKY